LYQTELSINPAASCLGQLSRALIQGSKYHAAASDSASWVQSLLFNRWLQEVKEEW